MTHQSQDTGHLTTKIRGSCNKKTYL